MSELIRTLFAGIQPDEQIYVAWKDAGTLPAAYTLDDWKGLTWNTTLLDDAPAVEEFVNQHPGCDVYYGIAHRGRGDRNALTRVTALWAEVDAKDFGGKISRARQAAEAFPAPPSFLVESGHGYHCYWLLSGPVTPDYAQEVMKKLCDLLGADHVHHPKAVLRVPGTANHKEADHPLPVTEVWGYPDRTYPARDLDALCGLSDRTRRMVVTGKLYGRKSRSEVDWHVLGELQDLGVSEPTIRTIYALQPVGAKVREEGDHYFLTTLEKASQHRPRGASAVSVMDDGYLVATNQGKIRISTFVFEPHKLLISADGSGEDAFLGTMTAGGVVTPDVVMPKSAFATTNALLRFLPKMEWQWLGTDQHVKQLLLHLHEAWAGGTRESAIGTQAIGRHAEYWVTRQGCLTEDALIPADQAPYVHVDMAASRTRETHTVPCTAYPLPPEGEYATLIQALGRVLPRLNRTHIILPALGWFLACPLKPLLLEGDVRFPHLNVFGTTGSGKTTLLKEVLFPLLGVVDSRPWTPNTTMFILRALLGSANAFPVHFGEYRSATLYNTRNDFLRVVLQSYDVGMDARGRADLSAECYPLLAPVIIDGEDAVGDPAFQQRAIVLNPHPADIQEGEPAFRAFQELQGLPLGDFAGRYIQRTLQETPASTLVRFHRALVRTEGEYPGVLPDRVRRNMAVVLVGLELFNEHLEHYGAAPVDPTGVFTDMIQETLSLFPAGTPRVAVDDFIEELVNALAQGRRTNFLTVYDATPNLLWVHMTSAHAWWERERRSRGRVTLEIPALRAQLRERHEYIVQEQVVETGAYGRLACFGVRVASAHDYGLNIPDRLDAQKFVINGVVL